MAAAKTKKCYYDVLGVERDATDDEITKAYKKIALKVHPDKNQDRIKEATAEFQTLSDVYGTLHDPQQRRRYDAELLRYYQDEAARKRMQVIYRCHLCTKSFITHTGFANHEKSKKHLAEVERLREELGDEEKDLDDEDIENESVTEDVEEEKQDHSEQNVNVMDKASSVDGDIDEDANQIANGVNNLTVEASEEPEDHDEPNVASFVAHSKKNKGKYRNAHLSGDSHDESAPLETIVKEISDNEAEASKGSKKKRRRAKKGEVSAENVVEKKDEVEEPKSADNTPAKCIVCNQDFPSRSKLFRHIKSTGHAAPIREKTRAEVADVADVADVTVENEDEESQSHTTSSNVKPTPKRRGRKKAASDNDSLDTVVARESTPRRGRPKKVVPLVPVSKKSTRKQQKEDNGVSVQAVETVSKRRGRGKATVVEPSTSSATATLQEQLNTDVEEVPAVTGRATRRKIRGADADDVQTVPVSKKEPSQRRKRHNEAVEILPTAVEPAKRSRRGKTQAEVADVTVESEAEKSQGNTTLLYVDPTPKRRERKKATAAKAPLTTVSPIAIEFSPSDNIPTGPVSLVRASLRLKRKNEDALINSAAAKPSKLSRRAKTHAASVDFVKRKDKRVQEWGAQQEVLRKEKEAAVAKKMQEEKTKKLAERKKALESLKKEREKEQQKINVRIKEMAGVYGEACSEEESDEDEISCLYCAACNKSFRTEKAFANHEKSKKHLAEVERLREEFGDEELEEEEEEDLDDEDIENEEEQKQDHNEQNANVIDKASSVDGDIDDDADQRPMPPFFKYFSFIL